jgi:hypothetical protein
MNRYICNNKWCKGTFYLENDKIEYDSNGESLNTTKCPKCISFDSELSGGVKWEDKVYNESRYDNTPHQIKYKINKFY